MGGVSSVRLCVTLYYISSAPPLLLLMKIRCLFLFVDFNHFTFLMNEVNVLKINIKLLTHLQFGDFTYWLIGQWLMIILMNTRLNLHIILTIRMSEYFYTLLGCFYECWGTCKLWVPATDHCFSWMGALFQIHLLDFQLLISVEG